METLINVLGVIDVLPGGSPVTLCLAGITGCVLYLSRTPQEEQ